MFICCCAVRLTPKNSVVGQLVEKVDLNHADDEPFELTKEIETQIIGNLLPDDDDLLSGVFGDIGYTHANNQDEIDDDIFFTGGGMELEADGNSKLSKVNGGASYSQTMVLGKYFFFKKNSNFAECRPGGSRQRIFFFKKIKLYRVL